ncbi:iron complex transport system substrate-binding protein [Nocardioides thalensis]|uniref:Iron complex transport system substrate-binding protein n=1 Tax=Nocardioides thalensis TaxID=1914755 RepID=A0A853C209_9ACTN|nr:ABC transporter substrate-binding protein [Nocardioides thalensis]NYJ00628.1 iron complex transport system substrate-binding protein [Nocardioides thalensis]
MSTHSHRRAGTAALASLLLAGVLSACGQESEADAGDGASSAGDDAFPVSVLSGTEADGEEITIEEQPDSIVSLSPTATEMLWELGAGDQVVAVDDQSDYPEGVPVTKLSGYEPNVEAILGYEPDLVVTSGDSGDLVAGLERVSVPTLVLPAATTLDEMYGQFERLGAATGHPDEADELTTEVKEGLEAAVADAPDAAGTTYYHELDPSLYSVTSDTFIGQIYGLFGLESIGDEAKGGDDYPQLSEEFVVSEDPDLIFLADSECCGVTPEQVADRGGWDSMEAVEEDRIFPVNEDVASRWGPRVVEFAESIAATLAEQPADAG